MRPSPLRHPLAVLRQIIGVGQKELGALVGRSARTIQAVELGRLKLGSDLAQQIAKETGVSLEWLLASDAAIEPVDPAGYVYTKAAFEETQGRKLSDWGKQEIQSWTSAAFSAFATLMPVLYKLILASQTKADARPRLRIMELEKMLNEVLAEKCTQEYCDFMRQCRVQLTFPDGNGVATEAYEKGDMLFLPAFVFTDKAALPPSPKPRAPRTRKASAPPPNRAR